MTPRFYKKTMDELHRPETDKYRQSRHFPMVVILDDVRSMHNVGSAFRTCDAFNIDSLILGGITPAPPHRDIHKTALGATESVKWESVRDLASRLKELKADDYKIIAVEQVHNSTSLEQWQGMDSEERIALIFGNEVDGVSQDLLDLCDACIEIPQFGSKHSLNISVTIGIVLWQYVNNRMA